MGQAPMDSVKLFKDFESRGRTTASAYTHFDDLINDGQIATRISPIDLQKLNSLILNSKTEKHKQTKYGQENLFIVGFYHGNEARIIILDGERIVNLTSRLEYQLTDVQKGELKKMTDAWKD